MIEFFGKRYCICRADKMNIDVKKRHVREEDKMVGKRLFGAGEYWTVEGHHATVSDALSAVYEDMLSELIADDEKMVELDTFKRNLVRMKKLIMAKMEETVKAYIEMEREYETKAKGPNRQKRTD